MIPRSRSASTIFCFALLATAAHAAVPQRTFVSTGGNDANPCSLTAPCRGFAAAVTAVTPGGEVIALDSGGYGPVTISQSVSIIAPPGIYAGISVPATGNATGVAITGAGINVVLRGLSINSIGGTYGIRMTNGAELNAEDCVIANFAVSAGAAVSVETAGIVKISGTVIRDNAYGIIVGYGANANVANSQVLTSAFAGIRMHGGPAATTTSIFIADTLVTGTGVGGNTECIDNFAQAGQTGLISATRVTLTGCGFGIFSESSGGATTISYSMVTGNVYGIAGNFGTMNTLGNNHINGNENDFQGTITKIGLQ